MNLGRLKKVELRDVWKSEAQDFTPWLAREENLALLGDAIGLDLELEAVEENVGPFRADILCKEDGVDDAWILIENQIERTDHTHLGQLLTYAAGLNTVTIVWIAQRFTDEHRAALDWLNEVTNENIKFFGLEVELWRIGDSPIAPKFNAVSIPNAWTKGKTGTNTPKDQELTPAKRLQLKFWTAFHAFVLDTSSVIRPQQANPCHWMSLSIGTSKAHPYVFVDTQKKRIGIRLKIHPGEDRQAIYNLLLQERKVIEAEIGSSLAWEEMPDKKSSYVSLRKQTDPNKEADWPEQQKWLLEQLEKFYRVFGPRIKNMDTGKWQPEDVEDRA
jgi:hypothetical protein